MRVVPGLILLALLAGCAAPRTQRIQIDESANRDEIRLQSELALEGLLDDDLRLQWVAYDLKSKAVAQCGEQVKHDVGVYALNQDMVPKQLQEAARSKYHITQRLRVLAVFPGSGGEEAGLRPEDEIVSIDGWLIPHGELSVKLVRERTEQLLKDGKPLNLKVARGNENIDLTLTPKKECDFPVVLHGSDALNAFADGKNVFITRGMMRFAQDDTELALVVSHEMAHNSMEHMKARQSNYMLGSILDVLIAVATGVNTQGGFGNIAASAYSQEFEAEADYVGMYIMAAAGKDLDNAPKFWRRMAAAHPTGIDTDYSSSHPSTSYRLLALEQTVREIKGKVSSGSPLVPDMKQKAAEPASKEPDAVAGDGSNVPAAGQDSPDVVDGLFIGKEVRKSGLAGMVQPIAIRISLANKSDREIATVAGTLKLLDDSGSPVGSLSFRSQQPIPGHGQIEITKNVYPVVFSGYARLKELEAGKIRAEFVYDTIEFAGTIR